MWWASRLFHVCLQELFVRILKRTVYTRWNVLTGLCGMIRVVWIRLLLLMQLICGNIFERWRCCHESSFLRGVRSRMHCQPIWPWTTGWLTLVRCVRCVEGRRKVVLHALYQYLFAREVWQLSAHDELVIRSGSSIGDWWQSYFDRMDGEKCCVFVLTVWVVWGGQV